MKKTILFGTLIILGLASCTKEEVKPSETSTAVQNYTNFKITSIQVNKIPMVNSNSESWDTFDGPDLRFNIENYNTDVLYKQTNYFENINYNNLPIKWDFSPQAYPITNFEVNYFISIYDFDYPDTDNKIGYVGFNFNQHKTGYPTSITKTSNDGSISITINGNWY